MLKFVPFLLLVMLSLTLSAPVSIGSESTTLSSEAAESPQASSSSESPPIDVISPSSPGTEHDPEIESDDSSKDSRVLNLPPRFKYMEDQLQHKRKDLEEEDEYEASIAISSSTLSTSTSFSTTPPATPSSATEIFTTKTLIEESSTVYESVSLSITSTSGEEVTTTTAAYAIHPRFKYMEAQEDLEKDIEQLLSEDDEATTSPTTTPTTHTTTTTASPLVQSRKSDDMDSSAKYPTLVFGGFLPGPTGFVRTTKKLSVNEKEKKFKEMDEAYAPILDDIKEEFGRVVQEEKEKYSTEVLKLRQNIQDLKTEIATNKLEEKRPYWLPFWG